VVRKILIYPHPLLKKVSLPVEEWGKREKETVKALKKLLLASKIGVGLSAPQIGVNQRIFVMREEEKMRVLINPQIEVAAGKKVFPLLVDAEGHQEEFLEGCLSFPHLYAPVKRWLKIKASWEEPCGRGLKKKTATFGGLAAIVFQHELDHLEGILFVERARQAGRAVYRFDSQGRKKRVPWRQLVLE